MFRTATKFLVRRYSKYRPQMQSSIVNQRSFKLWSPLPHKSILGISGDILKQGSQGIYHRMPFINPKSSTLETYSKNIKIIQSKHNDSSKILLNTAGKFKKFLGGKQNLYNEISKALQVPQTCKCTENRPYTVSSSGEKGKKGDCSKSKPCGKGKGKKKPGKPSDYCKKDKKDSGKDKRHCIPTKMKIGKKLCCPEGVVVCERKATCSKTEVTRTICLEPITSKSKIPYFKLKRKDSKCKRNKEKEPCKVERGDPCAPHRQPPCEEIDPNTEPCKKERGDPCKSKKCT